MECESVFKRELHRVEAENASKKKKREKSYVVLKESELLEVYRHKTYFQDLNDHPGDTDSFILIIISFIESYY